MTVTLDPTAAGATILVEAVVEDEYVKHEVIRALAAAAPAAPAREHDVVAQHHLAVGIERDAGPVLRAARLQPGHEDEARRAVLSARAEPAPAPARRAFCETLGKIAVEVPDEPGFVVNRLLFPYLFDAVRLLERTGVEPGQIDSCMKLGASYPMGPLELLDFVGLDVADAIGEALFADTGEGSHRPPAGSSNSSARESSGKKSGAGFYEYRYRAQVVDLRRPLAAVSRAFGPAS